MVEGYLEEQAVYPGAEGFDHVEGEGWSGVVVGVEEAELGVESGDISEYFLEPLIKLIEMIVVVVDFSGFLIWGDFF